VVLEGPGSGENQYPATNLLRPVSEGLGSKLELLRVKQGKDSRSWSKWKQVVLELANLPQHSTVPLERTQISPSLYKLKPTQPSIPASTHGRTHPGSAPGCLDFGLDNSRAWK